MWCVCVCRFLIEEGGHRRQDLLLKCHHSSSARSPLRTNVREEGEVVEVAEYREVSLKESHVFVANISLPLRVVRWWREGQRWW